jgi:PAS domain S-box-containing protein
VRKASGEVRYVHEKCEHIRDASGKIARSIGMVQDITEQKKVEEALEHSNQKINEILSSIQDDFYVLDRDWKFVFVSNLFTSRIKKEPKDFLGKNIWKMFPKHLGTIIEENFRAAMEKREIRRFEMGGKYTDAWYRITAFPSPDGITVLGTDVTEQKKIEEALMKSEEEYSSLFSNMIDGFVYCKMIFDDAGKPVDFVYLQVNDAFERMTGLRRDLIVGKKVSEVIPGIKEDNPELFEIYGKVARTGQTDKDKHFQKYLNMWLNVSVYSPAKGYFAAVLEDITERKKAEEDLERSNQRITESLESIKDAFYVLDHTWNFVYANKKTTDFIGLKSEDFIGKNFWVMFPKHVGTPLDLNLREAMEKREIRKFEMPGKYAHAWYEVTIYPSIEGITVLATDISERKQAEEAVKSSKLLLESVFNSMYEGVFILDKTGKVIDFNDAFCRINKFKNREDTLRSINSLGTVFKAYRLDGSYVPVEEWPATKALQGESNTDQEYIVERTDLGVHWITSNSYSPLRNEKGEIVGAIQTMHDITDRKKAEDSLRESDERFRLALKNAPVSVAAQDCNLRYIWAFNQHTARPEQIIGKLDREIFKPKEAEYVEKIKRRVLEENIELREQMWLERPSGRIFVDITWSPIHDKNGIVIGVASATVDLSKMKEIEVLLKESEQRWATTLASIGDAVIATDISGKIMFMNGVAEALTGWSIGEATGKPVKEVFKIVNEQTRLEVENPIDRVLREGVIVGLANHTVLIQKEGAEVPIDDSGAPIKDKEGTIIGVVLIFRDITERRKTDNALRKQSSLVDLSPDAIIVKKTDDIITFWSQGAQSLYGYTKGEAIGQKSRVLLKTKLPEPYDEIISQLKRYGRWSGEKIHQTKSGREIIVDSRWLATCDVQGKIDEILETNVDVTERKQLQNKLEEYAKNLEKLVEERTKQLKDSERLAAIGATAGMVGHDIRNPLQAITGDLYLAKTDLASIPESEEKQTIQESLTEIEKNIDYINKIVQDLQDFARPLKPNVEETDLKLVIDQLLAKNGLPENINVSVKVESGARLFVADSTFINRIMYNLVNNAIQAMPKGGQLFIHVYKESNDVVISVKDTGVGIPEAVKGKLFTPMFTTKSKGQGFGLAVIKRMTEALGGTVTFESQEGKGTTFTVHIPPKK